MNVFNNMTKRMIATLEEITNISVNGEDCLGDSIDVDDEFVTITTLNSKSNQNKIHIGGQRELEIIIHGNVQEVVTKRGNVSCNDVYGNVKVQSGNIECDNVKGDVKTSTGNITAKKVHGDIKTGIGNIIVKS